MNQWHVSRSNNRR